MNKLNTDVVWQVTTVSHCVLVDWQLSTSSVLARSSKRRHVQTSKCISCWHQPGTGTC